MSLGGKRYPWQKKIGHNAWASYGSSGKRTSTTHKIKNVTTNPASARSRRPCRALHLGRLATKGVEGAADDAGRVAFLRE